MMTILLFSVQCSALSAQLLSHSQSYARAGIKTDFILMNVRYMMDMVPFVACLQFEVLTMFSLIFFFVPCNQGYQEALVGRFCSQRKNGQNTLFVQQTRSSNGHQTMG
jgi:hypothetical protein